MSGTITSFTGTTASFLTKTALYFDQDGDAGTQNSGLEPIFSNYDADVNIVSGTGVIQPFVRIEESAPGQTGDGIESGYNYALAPDEKQADYPLDVKDRQVPVDLTDVAVVKLGGALYYEFRLDVNEPNSDTARYISLDVLKIYNSNQNDLNRLNPGTGAWTENTPTPGASTFLAYDLDGDRDVSIFMDANLQAGSGKSDLAIFIPTEFFTLRYAYFYSIFGGVDLGDNDGAVGNGYEEWSYVRAQRATLTGVKYNDLNGDGDRDAGENGLGNWSIYLDVNDDGNFDAGTDVLTTTDGQGNYSFSVQIGIEYKIREIMPSGWHQTQPVGIDGDPATADGVYTVTPTTAGTTYGPYNFGNFQLLPNIHVEKVTNGSDGPTILEGEEVTWTYTVTNTGNVALENVTVTDDNGTAGTGDDFDATYKSGDTNSNGKLDLTETWIFEAKGTAIAGDYENTATAEGEFLTVSVQDDDGSSYFGADPAIHIEKVTNGSDGPTILAGEDVTWTYTVTNTGNVVLENVTVTDDNGTAGTGDDFDATYKSGDTNGDSKLDLTETWIFEAKGTAIAGDYENTATAEGDYADVTVDDDDDSSYFGADPKISIEKLTNGEDGPILMVGDAVTWTYAVKNIGNVDLVNIDVTDDNGTPLDTSDDASLVITYVDGDDGDGILNPGETWNFKAEGEAVAGLYENIAVAEGDYGDVTVDDDDDSSYFGGNPGIAIEKVTNGSDGPIILAGEEVTWTYTVTNTGNVALENVTVTDDNGTAGTGDDFAATYKSGDTNGDSKLDVTETWIFEAKGTAIAGDYENTAVAEGDFANVTVDDDDDSSYFGADPSVTIDKKINGEDDCFDILKGQAITYTFEVKNTGNVTLTNLLVTDNVLGDIGTIATLAAGASVTFTVGSTAGTGEHENTATVSGSYEDEVDNTAELSESDDACYFGAAPKIDVEKYVSVDGGQTWQDADTATGPKLLNSEYTPPMFKFVVTNTGNVDLTDVTLTDNVFKIDINDPGDPNDDDYTIEIGDLAAGDSETFYYTAVWQQGQHANTATAEGSYTDDAENEATVTDSDMAHYFGLEGPGVRTPGFWQQKTWQDFWDGDAAAPKQAGTRGFADGDVIWLNYSDDGGIDDPVTPATTRTYSGILIGDFNLNGVRDGSEQTLFYSTSEALNIINASNNVMGQDARFILDRSLIATWLNFLAGNPIDGPSTGPDSTKIDARDAIQWGIRWLQQTTPNEDGAADPWGDGALTGTKVPSSSAAWNVGIDGPDGGSGVTNYGSNPPQYDPTLDTPAGNAIHGWLDEYNNFGTVRGLVIAFDADTII